MYRKIAAAGVTAAVILGAGTAALAASGPDATAGSGSTSSPATTTASPGNGPGKRKLRIARALIRHTVHGSIVTDGKDGYVRHTAILGTITAVSPTALTVKASDGVTQTFTLTHDTKVRERTPGQTKGTKGTAGTVSDLKTGDSVGVLGKSAESSSAAPTATIVIDGLS